MPIGAKIKKDSNPYAKEYLEKVMAFSYVLRVYYTASVGETRQPKPNYRWNDLVADLLELPLMPLRLLLFQDTAFNAASRTDITQRFYDEIEVNPCSRSKTNLRTEVPIEGTLKPAY